LATAPVEISAAGADIRCPVCSESLDRRDLAQIAEHIHDGRVIEVLEGLAGATRDAGATSDCVAGLRDRSSAESGALTQINGSHGVCRPRHF
jgi:hypothetical protein